MFKRRTLLLAATGTALLSACAQERAPEVNYTLLNGEQLSSKTWAGKVMLVNFWATSCATCVKEMPQIVATHRKYAGQGFDTLAVAMSYDPPEFVARYAQTRQLPFTVALDTQGQMAQAFGDIQLTPTTLLINAQGEIVKRYVGEPDFAALHRLIEQLLPKA